MGKSDNSTALGHRRMEQAGRSIPTRSGDPTMSLRCVVVFIGMLPACGLVPVARAGSSNSLMDVSPDGTRLLVANADNGTVTVVDTAARKVLHEIAVGEKPEGVTWIGNGPQAAVTAYHED